MVVVVGRGVGAVVVLALAALVGAFVEAVLRGALRWWFRPGERGLGGVGEVGAVWRGAAALVGGVY